MSGYLAAIKSVLDQSASVNLPASCEYELSLEDCSVECETRLVCRLPERHTGPHQTVISHGMIKPTFTRVLWEDTDQDMPVVDAPYNLVKR